MSAGGAQKSVYTLLWLEKEVVCRDSRGEKEGSRVC